MWAGGAVFVLLQACLRLSFSPRASHIRFRWPRVRDYINRMHIKELRFDDLSVDLAIRRRGSDVALHTERREDDLEVAMLLWGGWHAAFISGSVSTYPVSSDISPRGIRHR